MNEISTPKPPLLTELQSLLNRHSAENYSNTPDFILAEYLFRCLDAFNWAVIGRAAWYGRLDKPGQGSTKGRDMNEINVEDSRLVAHARREFELCGQTAEDPDYAQSIIDAVAAFASYGHSGGSAMVAIEQLHRLLRFKTLAPITSDPGEWSDVSEASGYPMWQNKRDPSYFSTDGGATFYSLDDRAAIRPTDDGQPT